MKYKGRFLGTPEQRFLHYAKIDDGCWGWGGPTNCYGYGRLTVSGSYAVFAHRYSYERYVSPIPTGLGLDHLCRNRACVRPDHLEPVTQRTNVLRGKSFAAANSSKTHCSKGHPLSGDNLVVYDGKRKCVTCSRANALASFYRRRIPPAIGA